MALAIILWNLFRQLSSRSNLGGTAHAPQGAATGVFRAGGPKAGSGPERCRHRIATCWSSAGDVTLAPRISLA
jgi:hypothetical protein